MITENTWSDIEDRYQRSLIDRKIKTRKRLFKALESFLKD